jgi:hypothetical protein
MPTTRPRYTITDTGDTSAMLDVAQSRWPEIDDRRQLLLRLARAGHVAVAREMEEREHRAARQREGLRRAPDLVDADALLDDAAWR